MPDQPFQVLLGVTCLLVGFGIGLLAGRIGRAKAVRQAADRAWRMSETLHRHSEP
jgi:hypothetical protein